MRVFLCVVSVLCVGLVCAFVCVGLVCGLSVWLAVCLCGLCVVRVFLVV